MSDKPWRDDLGDIAGEEKIEKDSISTNHLIVELTVFLNEYDTFYESWLNNEINQESFHQTRNKKIKDLSNKICKIK